VLLTRLKLHHFRTYDHLDLRLSSGVSLLHGPNGAGKTNVLEAIFVLATTKSFRTRTDREVISWGEQDEPRRYARLEADAEANGGPFRVDMAIVEGTGSEIGVRKQFKLNGSPKRAADVVGCVKAVLFSTDDAALVTGSPSGRRRFMDLTLCQVDHRYLRLLQEYGRVLTQRNSLLQRLRGRPDPASLLEFWDDRLTTLGTDIIVARKSMLRVLNDFAQEAYADIAGIDERRRFLSVRHRLSGRQMGIERQRHVLELFDDIYHQWRTV
jgi:DNA replication and repair protein RecF